MEQGLGGPGLGGKQEQGKTSLQRIRPDPQNVPWAAGMPSGHGISPEKSELFFSSSETALQIAPGLAWQG